MKYDTALKELNDFLGSRLLIKDEIPEFYAEDESYIKVWPMAVAIPETVEEIEKIVEVASRYKIPITPRGSGTSLSGGAVPCKNGLVVDLRRLNRILEEKPEDFQVLVEPGVIYDELNKQMYKYELFLPPNPGSGDQCTIGGMVASNASGPRSFKYGSIRRWILGVEVVTPAFGKLWFGSKTLKYASTYDLVGFIVGSEGTLGIITKILLRLAPLPSKRIGVLMPFNSIEDAGKAIIKLAQANLDISALEIIDDITLEAVNKAFNVGFPKAEALVLMEIECTSKDTDRLMSEIEIRIENLNEIVSKLDIAYPGPQVFFDAEEMWSKRRLAGESLEHIYGGRLDEDVVVPISRLVDLIREIKEISEKYSIKIAVFGHAGEGHIHPCILVKKNEALSDEIEKVKEAIFKVALKLEGALTGEHGIGLAKKRYLNLEVEENVIKIMKALKGVFDPNNIMNPDKKF